METNERHVEKLRILVELASLVNSTLDTHEIRRRAVEAAARLVDADRASLLLIEGAGSKMRFEIATGDEDDTLQKIRLVKGQGIAGFVADTCEPVIIADAQTDPRYFSGLDLQSGFVTRSMLAVPVMSRGKLVGILEAMCMRPNVFSEEDRKMLSAAADQVGIAIENARLYQRLRSGFFETWIIATCSVVITVLLAILLLK
ncbi:MAG: GAF domain-containing protein [Coriobacteriia bacterium]